MARLIGAKCRICRRLGTKLFLKGTRCETAHCAMEKRNKPPGQHGDKRVRLTDYGLHLREVQRAKKMYGVMQRQFTLYYKTALRKGGNTGDNLVQLLEQRLDNVLLIHEEFTVHQIEFHFEGNFLLRKKMEPCGSKS